MTHGHLLQLLKDFGAVLVPVYWGGDKVGHENAMSVYLPDSKASWVLFNVGCRLDDLSYWLAHEFGHCLHNILTTSEIGYFSGTSVESDFVEAPSQMFENWVWDADVLNTFARHYKTGEPLPKETLDGMIRARYRDSHASPTPLEPDRVYEYRIEVGPIANRFRAGHRIRIEVASASFPQFDRNMNTGGPFGAETVGTPATQRVLHDAEHPSHVVLPIVPD